MTILCGLILAAGFGLAAGAFAAQGMCPDGTPPPCGGGGGNKPPVELSNNLSYPAIHIEDAATAPEWAVPAGVLGESHSYGCDLEETDGTFTYPNTSCVDSLGTFLTAAECTAAGAPCEGLPVSRIYWQKVTENQWWAQSKGPLSPVTVAYLDWGDNLESNTWSERSVVRVETSPFASLIPWDPPYDPALLTCEDAAKAYGLDPLMVCQVGFQMWHVSGHGPDEQWGARATEAVEPWLYLSPFAVIQTTGARLHMAKLAAGTATCPSPTGPGDEPPQGFTWDPLSDPPRWVGAGYDACTLRDSPYTAELNVGGKYVYGYNWMLRRDEMPSECGPGWVKSGWWRLTFYTPNAAVVFDPAYPVVEPLAPPPTVPALPGTLGIGEATEEEEGPLYTATIDYGNNLTYIDICISPRTGGGGGGNNH